MKIDIPRELKTQKEIFSWLKDNNDDIIYRKKSALKKADGLNFAPIFVNPIDEVVKGAVKNTSEKNELKARLIINTTMIRDSHKDVHINGIWNKSLKENKRIKHIQEHQMAFDKVIADKDDLKVFTKTYSWKDLGYNAPGKTEALVFDSTIKQSRNAYMFDQYEKGHVDNHSVGMWYVELKLALNSDEEEDAKYKAIYDKYIDDIANKDEVEKDGYFYAVLEAKCIEGSAVPMGSNPITPTQSVKNIDVEQTTDKEIALKEWLRK